MKTTLTFSIALLLLIGLAAPFNANAEDFLYKTALVVKESITFTPTAPTPPVTDPLCNTTAGTPTTATPAITYDAYRVLVHGTGPGTDFPAISFRIVKADGSGEVNNYLNVFGAATFNTSTGELSYTLNNITPTRKKLLIRLYLNNDGTGTPFEEKEFYTSQVSKDPPVGTIIPYYGNEDNGAIESELNRGGWYFCNGESIAAVSEDILFAAEKTYFSTVTGSMTLPDLREAFLRGAGTNADAAFDDPAAPRAIGSVQYSQVRNHSHLYDKANTPTGSHDITLSTTSAAVENSTTDINVLQTATLNNGNHSHTISYTPTQTTTGGGVGVGANNDTRPDNIAVNYLIRVRK